MSVEDEIVEVAPSISDLDFTADDIADGHIDAPDESVVDEVVEETDEDSTDEIVDEQSTIEANTDENTTEEVVDESDNTEESNSDENKQESTEEVVEETDEDGSQYYSELSETTGYEINGNEEIVSAFAELDELRQADEAKYTSLPNELQMAIEVFNKGGDYQTALQQASMDYEGMSAKEVLKQKFFNDNSESLKGDKGYAEIKFERDYDTNYGIIDKYNQITEEDEKAEFYEENKKDIEFAKASHEHDVINARKAMGEFKTNSTSVQEKDEHGFTEEENLMHQQHEKDVSDTSDTFDGIQIGFGDNAIADFNLPYTEADQVELKETLNQPIDFIEENTGVKLTAGQVTDYDKLATFITLMKNMDSLPAKIGQYYFEQSDKKSVEKIIVNPPGKKGSNVKPGTEKSNLGEAISLFNKQANSKENWK